MRVYGLFRSMYEILPKMEHLSSLMFWRQGGQTCPIEPKISDLNCVTAPSEDDLKLLHHTTIITTPPDIGQSIKSKEEMTQIMIAKTVKYQTRRRTRIRANARTRTKTLCLLRGLYL